MDFQNTITDKFKYPLVGFHFAVYFHGLLPTPIDMAFQSVTGLTATVETVSYKQGGENRFAYEIPTGLKFSTLVLKRGLKNTPSILSKWCEDTYENFVFKPLDIVISLLDENHLPLHNWNIVGAYPLKYEISEFNAETSAIVIQTLELKYKYFKTIL